MSGEEVIVFLIVGCAALSLIWRAVKFFKPRKNTDANCSKNECDC